MENVKRDEPVYEGETVENEDDNFSLSELKLLNLIIEIIINISIRESYEEGHPLPPIQ